MSRKILLAALVAAPLLAMPVRATDAPPPPPPPGAHAGHNMGNMGGMKVEKALDMRRGMFPSMSEAGRKIMHDAMMASGSRRDVREKMAVIREKMLTALEAERFDAAAVKRAMDEERALAEATRQQRQSAMLAAFGKLSTEDRKAFVADSRAMKARMQQRMAGWRDRMRSRMQMRQGGPMPPPPPQPPLED